MKKLLIAVVLLWAANATAQVVNPKFIEFQSNDHAIVTRYEVGFFLSGAPAPVQTVSMPKAEFVAQPDAYWRHELPRPVLGNFVVKARAFAPDSSGGELASEWSLPSGPFSLLPVAPAALRAVP